MGQAVADGATVLGPAAGDQACGEVGDGRLPEPAELRDELIAAAIKFKVKADRGRSAATLPALLPP